MVFVLNAIGPLRRRRPAAAVVIADPDADVLCLFLRPAKPGDDQAACGFADRRGVALWKLCLGEDKVFAHETGKSWRGFRLGRSRFQLIVRVGNAVVVGDVIDAAVLRADQQIRFAVADRNHRPQGWKYGRQRCVWPDCRLS